MLELFHGDVRRDAERVVPAEEVLALDLPALGPDPLLVASDRLAGPRDRLRVALDLRLDDPVHVVAVLPHFGEIARDLPARPVEHRDELGRVRDLREDSERSSDQQAGKVSLLAVGRDDPVGEEEVQGPRMVDEDRGLPRGERPSQLLVLRPKTAS